ncbi:MAG: hypothetical protein HYV04_05810 [Deltaproteobacteria bacterium]|nr:hypothetical protein [Deltaproteobacteria bacterium]
MLVRINGSSRLTDVPKLKAAARSLVVSAFLLGSFGCARQLVTSAEQSNSQGKIAAVKERLASVRGLNFISDVPIAFESREGLRRHLEAELLEEYGQERIQELSLAYAKLGLYPKGFDLKNSLLKLYSSELLGFYNLRLGLIMLPRTGVGQESFTNGDEAMPTIGEGTLVHELAHALQDQHFSLRGRLKPSRNPDEALALRAVAEGDSILTELGYASGDVNEDSLTGLLSSFRESRDALRVALGDVPASLTDKLLFQYEAGVSFVYQMLKKKGWRGVDLLYAFPPQSTEQVLHPEKYYDLPDPPTRIDVGDLSALFSPSWKEIENNTLGELMIECLFKEFFPTEVAKKVATGWDGDRFVAFRRGEEMSFIWVTAWDSPEDSLEFVQHYQQILSRKYGGPQPATSQSYVERRDRVVLVVEGLEKREVEKKIGKIWLGLKLAKSTFARPPAPAGNWRGLIAKRGAVGLPSFLTLREIYESQ